MNHIDFENILFNEIYFNTLESRDEIFYIGQTRSSIIGYYNVSSSFTIKDDNENIILVEKENIDDFEIVKKIRYLQNYKESNY